MSSTNSEDNEDNDYESTYGDETVGLTSDNRVISTRYDELTAKIKPAEIDRLLSEQLTALKFDDREFINEEIHGVRCLASIENSDMINGSLKKLSQELSLINFKPEYDRSQELARTHDGSFVNTASFRLMFLRAELFDAKKAAERLVTFLEILMYFFDGKEELLLRPLRISDLGKEDIALLKAGSWQLLPFRDRSGRRILTVLSDFHGFRSANKIILYLIVCAAESIETQRKGLVCIVHAATSNAHIESKKVLPGVQDRKIIGKLVRCYPVRLVAIHCSFPDTLFYRLKLNMIIMSTRAPTSYRIRAHFGGWAEVNYKLMGYGIPVNSLPVTHKGNVRVTTHLKWMCLRRLKEGEGNINIDDSDDKSLPVPLSVISSIIECPNMSDVIFRTGKSYVCHPGNVMFRDLIESNMEEYYAATRRRKAELAWGIIREVERRGGRFLKWHDRGWWMEFEDRSEVRYKIPTYFRDFNRNMNARRNRATRVPRNQICS